MVRPRVDPGYVRQVETLAAAGMNPRQIGLEIERRAAAHGWTDFPSERTVYRLYREFKARPEAYQRDQMVFRWPESLEDGALPWEASRAALDCLRYWDSQVDPPPLSVRLVRWYWRLSLAAPDLDAAELFAHAFLLECLDVGRLGGQARPPELDINNLQWRLAYQPWQSDGNARAFWDACQRPDSPLPDPFAPVVGRGPVGVIHYRAVRGGRWVFGYLFRCFFRSRGQASEKGGRS